MWRKAEAADPAEAANALPIQCGTTRQGRVFDDRDAMGIGDGTQAPEIGRQAIEVYGDDCFGARPDERGDLVGIDSEGVLLHVRPHDPGTTVADGRTGGDIRVGHGDHFVARADAQSTKG